MIINRVARVALWAGAFVFLAFTVPRATKDVRVHLVRLWRHAQLQRDELLSADKLERLVRRRYYTVDWQVQLVAGTKDRYPLGTKLERRSTLERLGRGTISEGPLLTLSANKLPDAYRGALVDTVVALGVDTRREVKGDSIAALLSVLRGQSSYSIGTAEYVKVLKRAQTVLGELPETSVLRNALLNFRFDALASSPYFRSFSVNTDPLWDSDGAWSRHGVTAWNYGKTERIRLQRVSSSDEELVAYAIVAPRYVEIQLERPWLSEELLDNLQRNSAARPRLHFSSATGRLHLLPQKLWLRLGDEFLLTVEPPADVDRIEQWARVGVCCRIFLNEAKLDVVLDGASLRRIRQGTYLAHGSDRQPELFAVISKRRDPEI